MTKPSGGFPTVRHAPIQAVTHQPNIIVRPTINVPPPTVIQPTPDIWTEWVFPGLTLFFAALAGVMSIVLWRISESALETAKRELKLVSDDLEFSKQQVAYLNRHASLSLRFDSGFEQTNYVDASQQVDDGATRRWVTARLFLHNNGDKTARDASVILLIPPECRPYAWFGQQFPNPTEWYRRFGYHFVKNEEFEEGRRDRVLFQASTPIYAGLPSQIADLTLVVPTLEKWSSDIRWQIACDDGTTPVGGAFGILTFDVVS